MRILIVTQYFAPEVTAASFRLEPLATGLAARGHDVEVLCEAPSHPRGFMAPEYQRRIVSRRHVDGCRRSYVWVRASPSRRARARLASYASYAAVAAGVGSCMRRPDVILASSPPLSVGAVGAVLAARHRVPWVMDVRDLWPEAAVALGELREGRVLSFAEALERRLYDGATAITTPTAAFAAHIGSIAGLEKVRVLANGTTEEWLRSSDEAPDRAGNGLPDDAFAWTYAGNLGLSQDLETAIAAAGLLGDGFELLLLGDGTRRPQLEERAARTPGARVTFRDSVPPAVARRIMRASDSLIVTLADDQALAKSVPVKLYDSCAVGRPVVVAAPGEARRMAEEAGAALTVDPGDPHALAAAIRTVRDDGEVAARLSLTGPRFARLHLRERGVEVLEDLLVSVAETGPAQARISCPGSG